MSAGSQDVHFKPEPSQELLYASSDLLGWDLMISTAKTAKIYVGVDVSKASLDVYRPDTNELLKIENSEDAINELCLQLQKKKRQVMVVMEGTGGYEYLLQRLSLTSGLPPRACTLIQCSGVHFTSCLVKRGYHSSRGTRQEGNMAIKRIYVHPSSVVINWLER